jgi:hypothetical protein
MNILLVVQIHIDFQCINGNDKRDENYTDIFSSPSTHGRVCWSRSISYTHFVCNIDPAGSPNGSRFEGLERHHCSSSVTNDNRQHFLRFENPFHMQTYFSSHTAGFSVTSSAKPFLNLVNAYKTPYIYNVALETAFFMESNYRMIMNDDLERLQS